MRAQIRDFMNTRSNPKKAKPRKLLGPPPKQPPEVEALWEANDFEELHYRTMDGLRARKKRTAEQNALLVEHDAIESRINDDPEEVMRDAYQAIDLGTTLLMRLIRSRKLKRQVFATDGSLHSEWDEAFQCLESRLNYLNRQLVRLAEQGVPEARNLVFYQAKLLTKAFIRLAQAYPADFISPAESALTMPSLRAANPGYTADAKAIATAIHLAEKHPAGRMTDDKERIGELCGSLVVEILESIMRARREYRTDEETLKMFQNFHETEATYRGMTLEEYLRNNLYPTKYDHVMACAALPELRENPAAWWRQRVKPMLREEFDRLKKNPVLNAALWAELGRSTDHGTEGARWKALSDNCRNKLNQLARRAIPERFE